ncbi:MAG: PKD domain-containing protein [Gammaproteobacteria bacterium]|nr:PKD domain-containing protein [Gammaproteobacteria bacterium]
MNTVKRNMLKLGQMIFPGLAFLLGLAQQAAAVPAFVLEPLIAQQGETATVNLLLVNGAEPYAGVNAKIELPAGVTLTDISAGEAAANFTVDHHMADDGSGAAVLAYSPTDTITASQGILLSLNIQVGANTPLGEHAISFVDMNANPLLNAKHALANKDGTISVVHTVQNAGLWVISAASDHDRDGIPDIDDPDDDNDSTTDTDELAAGTDPYGPVPFFTISPGVDPFTVSLDASNSQKPESIVNYAWSASDGQSATGQTAVFTFSQPGTSYTVTLTITDRDGHTLAMQSQAAFPAAEFTRSPSAGTPPLTVTLNASGSSDADGNIVSYQWTSSDGQTIADGQTASLTYQTDGTYTITLTVTDNDGLSNSTQHSVIVSSCAFALSSETGSAPLEVTLEASVVGTLNENYSWTSSDGQIAAGSTAVMTFSTPGDHTVTLAVTGDNGFTCSSQHPIHVGNCSVSSFTVSQSDSMPVNVVLDASAAAIPAGNITGYTWTSSDGQTVAGATGSMIFHTPGTYPVTLEVTADNGSKCSGERSVVVDPSKADFTLASVTAPAPWIPTFNKDVEAWIISYERPSADSRIEESDQPDIVPAVLTLVLEAVVPTDTVAANYAWSINTSDQTAAGTRAELNISEPVTPHVITLESTDSNGVRIGIQHSVLVRTPPEARFIASPDAGAASLTVDLDASGSSDTDGEIVRYLWMGSDGQTVEGVTAAMTFDASGSYTITLEVTDNDGLKDSVQQLIDENVPPAARFTVSPDTGWAPLEVSLDAFASYDPDGTIISYDWETVDGQTAVGQTAKMTFNAPGTYVVTLTVTDDGGLTGTEQYSVPVPSSGSCASGGTEPVALLTASPIAGPAPLTVNLDAFGSHGSGDIVRYRWAGSDGQTAEGQTTAMTFNTHGFYDITLEVTDNCTLKHSAQQSINAKALPVARFTPPPDGSAPLTVSLNASDLLEPSHDPDGEIVGYRWESSDGQNVDGETASMTFNTPGTYPITLTVTDNDGYENSVQHSVVVTEPLGDPLIHFGGATQIGAGQALYTGFTISDGEPLKVLIRTVGFDDLNPKFTLFRFENGQLTLSDSNMDWLDDDRAVDVSVQGPPPLNLRMRANDAALVRDLTPGNYIVMAESERDAPDAEDDMPAGIGLISGEPDDNSRFSHFGDAAQIEPARELYTGFTISGDAPLEVLVRAIGFDGLNPMLTLFRFENGELNLVGSNGDWLNDERVAGVFVQGSPPLALRMGAQDAALLRKLAPGDYIAVAGSEGEPGGLGFISVEVAR